MQQSNASYTIHRQPFCSNNHIQTPTKPKSIPFNRVDMSDMSLSFLLNLFSMNAWMHFIATKKTKNIDENCGVQCLCLIHVQCPSAPIYIHNIHIQSYKQKIAFIKSSSVSFRIYRVILCNNSCYCAKLQRLNV